MVKRETNIQDIHYLSVCIGYIKLNNNRLLVRSFKSNCTEHFEVAGLNVKAAQ